VRSIFFAAAACALATAAVQVEAAGDPAAGKTKAQLCAACHGMTGKSATPQFPNLAGQHAKYMVKQLKAFKSGERKDPVMAPMAAPLSPQDMEDVSAYFASQ
jgi:cytochrome c553